MLRESDGISLLCDAGMPVHSGFFGALTERIQSSLIPPAPNRRELSALFGGYEAARYVHFFAMATIVVFLVVHVIMALLVPKSLRAMVRGN